MALLTLVSASGSPGVTATTLGVALAWPRPVVLVEADPTGGSGLLAGFFRGTKDPPGLVDLVLAHRSGLLAEVLQRIVLPIPDSAVSVLVGSRSHEQAGGLVGLWEPLLTVLREIAAAGQDVIVDAGRLGLTGFPRPLVSQSDLTLLLLRTSLPSVVAARSWAGALAAEEMDGHLVRAVTVGPARPYQDGEVARALGRPVLGSVAWDPRAAAVYAEGAEPARRGWTSPAQTFAASAYLRSIAGLGERARHLLAAQPTRPRSEVGHG